MLISAVRWRPLVAIIVLCSREAWSAQPSPSALDAYRRAVAAVEKREESRSTPTAQLSCSGLGDHLGAILVKRLPVVDADGHALRVNGALIHHWWGALFIAHVRPQDVVAVLQDYDHHARIYAPDVRVSKLLDRQGGRYHVLHETLSRSLIMVGLKIESIVDWSAYDQDEFSSHSMTMRVTEFEHAGTPGARERTPEQAKGWMWSEDSWWRVTRQADGACVTYETIALTRDIPWGWGWLLRGIIERFPANTLTDMLQRTRYEVLSRKHLNTAIDPRH
jgi:hypothetical protein